MLLSDQVKASGQWRVNQRVHPISLLVPCPGLSVSDSAPPRSGQGHTWKSISLFSLYQWFSKCGPGTSSITWELIWNANSWTPPQTTKTTTLGMSLSNLFKQALQKILMHTDIWEPLSIGITGRGCLKFHDVQFFYCSPRLVGFCISQFSLRTTKSLYWTLFRIHHAHISVGPIPRNGFVRTKDVHLQMLIDMPNGPPKRLCNLHSHHGKWKGMHPPHSLQLKLCVLNVFIFFPIWEVKVISFWFAFL